MSTVVSHNKTTAVIPSGEIPPILNSQAKALQYKKTESKHSSYRKPIITFVVFIVFFAGLYYITTYNNGEEDVTADDANIDLCMQNIDNCSPNERCETIPTNTWYRCMPCPEHHVATPNGVACMEECPPDHIRAENGVNCTIGECRPNFRKTKDGLSCKADVCALTGSLLGQQEINSLEGGFRHELMPGDHFGGAVARMGDMDGNGMVDLAVGARTVDETSTIHNWGFGSVFILLLNPDNTVLSTTRIGTSAANEGDTVGGLASPMGRSDYFGCSLSSPGDLDGDGVQELIVGARYDDDGGTDRGALYVLFMLATGSVKAQQKISATEGGGEALAGLKLGDNAWFGRFMGVVGDVDRVNGAVDVVVATHHVVYFTRLNLDGTMKSAQVLKRLVSVPNVNDPNPPSTGGVASVGDVDGNGVVDIAVGAPYEEEGYSGAVYVLLMQADGAFKAKQRYSGRTLNAYFGYCVSGLGDLDGDGIPDLAVGAPGTDHLFGAVHILLLNQDGNVKRGA